MENQIKSYKFILTENLGKLARWLRFLGYDSLLIRSISFSNIKRIAEKDRRIILTRDKKHIKQCKSKIVLIKNTDCKLQLIELKNCLSLSNKMAFSRCSKCNDLLRDIDKMKIKDQVPEWVFNENNDFRICYKCGKIYWKGTHANNILKIIDDVKLN